jgi:hypothetical protein
VALRRRYSGYRGQGDDRLRSTEGESFLRGSQPTDRRGLASFRAVYPGWYAGRTTHIHLKVVEGTCAVLTSQCFLPDALSEYLYTQLPSYRRERLRDTLNRGDGIALQAGGSVVGAVREEPDRCVAMLTLVVDPGRFLHGPAARPAGRPRRRARRTSRRAPSSIRASRRSVVTQRPRAAPERRGTRGGARARFRLTLRRPRAAERDRRAVPAALEAKATGPSGGLWPG